MTKLDEFRAKYPGAYDNIDDATLADALYKKHYSSMPREEFDLQIGLTPSDPGHHAVPEFDPGVEGYDPETGRVVKDTSDFAQRGAFLTGIAPGALVVGPALQSGSEWAAAQLVKATGGGEGKTAEDIQQEIHRQGAQVRQDNPGAAMAGNVTGAAGSAIAAMEAAPALFGMAAGQTIPQQIGWGGAGNIGLTWADAAVRGEDPETTAKQVTIAGLAGGAAPGLGAAWQGATKYAGSFLNDLGGLFRPKEAGVKRLAEAVRADSEAGKTMSPAVRDVLVRRGKPIANIDVVGPQTRALGEEAASRVGLGGNDFLEIRRAGQKQRIADDMERMAGGPTNRADVKARINEAGRAANDPMYQRAFSMPNAQSMWTPRLQQLTATPEMQQAIREAEKAVVREAANAGRPMPRPFFTHNADGTVTPIPGLTPNLHFWDMAYRELRAIKNTAYKQDLGDKTGIKATFDNFRKEVDTIVPEYEQARGVASNFFKAENAVDSGVELIKGNYGNMQQLARNSAKWQPWEREGIEVGATDAIIEGVKGAADPVKYLTNPIMKEKLTVALGRQGADKVLNSAAVEALFNQANKLSAKGTGRHFAGQAVIGGGFGAAGIGYGASTGDWQNAAKFAIPAMVATGVLKAGRVAGARRTAEEIVKRLVSQDPNAMTEVLKIAARSPENRSIVVALMKGLGQVDKRAGISPGARSYKGGNQPTGAERLRDTEEGQARIEELRRIGMGEQ